MTELCSVNIFQIRYLTIKKDYSNENNSNNSNDFFKALVTSNGLLNFGNVVKNGLETLLN